MHRAAYTGGLDGRHRFADETYALSGSVLASQVRGTPGALLRTQTDATHYFQRPDADHVSVDSSRTRLSGWSGGAELKRIRGRWRWETSVGATSPGFEINDLGFLRRGDEMSVGAGLNYSDPEEGDLFRRVNARLFQYNEWTFGGEPTERFLFYFLGGTFRNNHSLNVNGRVQLSSFSMTALRGGPALRENSNASVGLNYNSDRRNALQVGLSANYQRAFGTYGRSYGLRSELRWRPTARATVSMEPRLSISRDPSQYVTSVTDDGDTEYVFGEIERRTAAVTTRASYTFSPELTLQVYAQPFIGTGEYSAFSTVDQPAAEAFGARFDALEDQADVSTTDDTYQVDTDRDGQTDYTFGDPDFTFQQLRSTVVFRWQYQRGSNLYLVWNRGRTLSDGTADFAPVDGLGALFRGGANTFAVKMDFWFSG
jgi:hypothetical protein